MDPVLARQVFGSLVDEVEVRGARTQFGREDTLGEGEVGHMFAILKSCGVVMGKSGSSNLQARKGQLGVPSPPRRRSRGGPSFGHTCPESAAVLCTMPTLGPRTLRGGDLRNIDLGRGWTQLSRDGSSSRSRTRRR